MSETGVPSIPPRTGEGDRQPQAGGGGVLSATEAAFKIAKRERRSGNLPEALVWRELRKRPAGLKFRRQHPFNNLVLDFACLERRVAIEIDGKAHDMGDRPLRDQRRDAFLQSQGFAVLRLPATSILKDLNAAIQGIVAFCLEQPPLHHRTLSGGPPPRFGEVFD